MNELVKVFDNEQFGQIRTIVVDGKVWFVASDIAKAFCEVLEANKYYCGIYSSAGAFKSYFNNYVKERIKQENININNDALNLLNTICKRDATLLNQNLEILSLYPEKITTQVINKLCVASDTLPAYEYQ